jgi:creatinine amidohydrolase
MDKTEAGELLCDHLNSWRTRSYQELVGRIGEGYPSEAKGRSGAEYQVRVEVFWDGEAHGNIRVIGSIDDGRWRAVLPQRLGRMSGASGLALRSGRLDRPLENDVRITDMNWMQVEQYLQHDDRAVLPLGSTEQHSHLRLTVDCILPERVAADAAEPLGVPVFPVVPYGVTPYFREFPGSISLKVETHLRLVGDILEGMAHSGFRRILIVNGHGGNNAAQQFAIEWAADHPGSRVLFHNWWNAPRTWAKVQAIDPVAAHGSWMENFPWTRLPGVTVPDAQRPMVDMARVRALDPMALRAYLGDGNFGGRYQRSDDEMHALWQTAVDETRALLTGSWGGE